MIRVFREMANAPQRSSRSDVPELLASAARLGGVDAAALLLQEPGKHGTTAVAWHGLSEREASAIIPFAQTSYVPARLPAPRAVPDLDHADAEPDFATLAIRDAGFRAMRLSPIRDNDGSAFAVLLALRRTPVAGSPPGDELLDLVGSHAAALAQADFARRQQALSEAQLRAVVESLGEVIIRVVRRTTSSGRRSPPSSRRWTGRSAHGRSPNMPPAAEHRASAGPARHVHVGRAGGRCRWSWWCARWSSAPDSWPSCVTTRPSVWPMRAFARPTA
jgi:hypothetical protein